MMNEQIRKLAENSELNVTLLFNKDKLEQFAKLIILECSCVAKETRWVVPPSQEQISKSIKDHFGLR